MPSPLECGRRCRRAFAELFKLRWGNYILSGTGVARILFQNHPAVIALYSDDHGEAGRWFFGLPPTQ